MSNLDSEIKIQPVSCCGSGINVKKCEHWRKVKKIFFFSCGFREFML